MAYPFIGNQSYRHLEQKIIEYLKIVDPDLEIEHIDHSVVHSMDGGRNERLEATRKLYNHLGFEYSNYKEEADTANNHRQTKRQRTSSNNANNKITIRIRDQLGEEMDFMVKRSMRLSKVFDAYAARKGLHADAFRFLHDVFERLEPHQTPQFYEMEDFELIDALLEQRGC